MDWFSEYVTPGHALTLRVVETLFVGRSPFQEVAVLKTADFGHMLVLDGLVQTTERDEHIYHEMIAHVPLVAHAGPSRVLVVGGGDGGTVREVLRHPCVTHVDLCEIDAVVIEQSRLHLPTIACGLDDPRVHVHVADALEFVKQAKGQYDVVIVDSSDPVGPGEGLFSAAFYGDVRAALRPGGVVAVQTESPFAMQAQMERAYRYLFQVFAEVHPYLGVVPSYPGAQWSWALCRDAGGVGPTRFGVLPALEEQTRYYNEAVHRAAFALPSDLRRQLAALRQASAVGGAA